ncbi:MAG TPA: BrnA antitoxin family protein [Acetobacteraceae bacterium]|nr:BrnA antitoxin family protein [Acetobacteraceae bacterium]
MKASDDTRRYSPATLRAERARGKTRTRANAPAYPVDETFWRDARVVMPPPNKASVHLRLDADVLEWFRAQGRGHLSRMNAVLRSFMEAHKR